MDIANVNPYVFLKHWHREITNETSRNPETRRNIYTKMTKELYENTSNMFKYGPYIESLPRLK